MADVKADTKADTKTTEVDPNGDTSMFGVVSATPSPWAEPKGTIHADQYKTYFPGERQTRLP